MTPETFSKAQIHVALARLSKTPAALTDQDLVILHTIRPALGRNANLARDSARKRAKARRRRV